jgi:hypothetical protein
MATANPSTAIPKKVDVSTNDGKTFSEKVFFLELWSIGNTSSQKTIEVKGEGQKLNGPFRQIQFRFDKNHNYIYTRSDVNQRFDETYAGTGSEYSISGLSAGSVKTVIRIGKTNSANDVTEQYSGPAERVKVKVETVAVIKDEELFPPDLGRPQPEKGANPDPNTWKVVNMRNPPEMFKVVDDEGINVADNFSTQQGAQLYIDMRKQNPPQEPPDISELPETPSDAKLDKNGVILLFAPSGKESFSPDHNFRDDGKRFDFNDDFSPAMDLGGYFKINKQTKDEISPKTFGGPHSEDSPERARCYDAGINIAGDRVRLRIEHQHLGGGTGYTKNLEEKKLSLGNFVGRWVGIRYIGIHDGKTTRNVYLIDNKGLVNDKPANDWQVVANWVDAGQYNVQVKSKVKGEFKYQPPYSTYPKELRRGQQTIRIDTVGGKNDLEWKALFCRQINPDKPLVDLKITEKN